MVGTLRPPKCTLGEATVAARWPDASPAAYGPTASRSPSSGAPSVAARWGHLHQPPQDAGAHVIERPQDLMALLRP
jgi:hypothetical protein